GEIDRGGMGRVIRMRDEYLGRDVALKELLEGPTAGNGNSKPEDAAQSLRHRFLREAQLTARLEHPSIVPVYEAGRRDDGRHYYTMRLIQGQTLQEALRQRTTLRDRLQLLPHFI